MERTPEEIAALQRLQINYLCDDIMHRIDHLALAPPDDPNRSLRLDGLRANFKRLRHAITQVLGQSQAVLDLAEIGGETAGR